MNTTNSDKYDFYDELMSNKGYYIALKEDKYGIVDSQDRIIIPFIYDEYADDADNGLITVSLNGKFGIIDLNNNIIIPFEYEVIRNYLPENLVAKKNGKYGLINLNNEIISNFIYGDLFKIKGYDNYIAKLDSKWGIVDKNLNIVKPFIYDDWEIAMGELIHLTSKKGDTLKIKLEQSLKNYT